MITLKRAAAFEARIKELETEKGSLLEQLEAFKKNDITVKNDELVKQLAEVSNKNVELANAYDVIMKESASKDELIAKLKAEAETATEKAVAIVASQGIPMIKLDPDKEEKSDNPFLKTIYTKKR